MRPPRPLALPTRLRRLPILALAAALAVSACGKTDAPPPAAPDAATATPDAAPIVESPLASLAETLAAPLHGEEAIAAAAKAADTLMAWAEANPDHPEAATARLTAVRTRLLLAEGQPPADRARVLRGVVEQAGALARDTGAEADAEASRVAAAARALLAFDPEVRDVAVAPGEALALAEGQDAAASAVRTAWMARAWAGLEATRGAPTHERLATLARGAGRLLCAGCAAVHEVPRDAVERFLLEETNGAGLVCAEALGAADDADAPARAARLLSCPELRPDGPYEAVIGAGPNAMMVALLRRAGRLAGAAVPDTPVTRALEETRAGLAEAIAAPVRLPVAALMAPAPEGDDVERGDAPPAPIAGLGADGLAAARPALEVAVISPGGVRLGVRPTVAFRDGEVHSLSARAEATGDAPLPRLDGPPVVTLEALAEAERDEATGAIAALADGARAVHAAAEAAIGYGDEEPRAAEVVVDAEARSAAVAAVLDSLAAGGVEAFHFTRGDGHGRVLPLWVRAAPDEVPATLAAGYAQPIVVHVDGAHVDVWGPDKAGEPAPQGDADAKTPASSETGYRGLKLVRLRVAVPTAERGELGAETLGRVAEAIAYWRAATGHGPLVHVVGADDAPAADVLRVARSYQEADGEPLEAIDALWPGATCPESEPGGAAKRCATAPVVAFSRVAVPSSFGVTATPQKREARPAPPKASAEFCNQADIKANMARQARDFRFCYESQLRLDESLEGRVPVVFTIGLDGKVETVSISQATLKNDKVHSCIKRAVQRIRFGRPDGGVCVVRWPFVFQKR